MGNCYSSSVGFHDVIDQFKVKRKDTMMENTEKCGQEASTAYSDIEFDSTPFAPSNTIPFRHNGVAPFTRDERFRVMYDHQKTVIKKLLTRLKTQNETAHPGPEGITLESAFLDDCKNVDGGVAALARQLGINLDRGVGHYASLARSHTVPQWTWAGASVV